MTGCEHYDRSGQPMSLLEWAEKFHDNAYRTIANNHVKIGDVIVTISTVWLGINHSFTGGLLIFETMIFGGEHDQWRDRYSTEAQAVAGHDQAVAMVLDRAVSR